MKNHIQVELTKINWDKGEHEEEQIENISSYFRINTHLALSVILNEEYEVYELFLFFYGKKTKKTKIDWYESDKDARSGAEMYLRELISFLITTNESEDEYIGYYNCFCSVYGKNPTYRKLPAPTGCICGPKRRIKKSEHEYKKVIVDGISSTSLT